MAYLSVVIVAFSVISGVIGVIARNKSIADAAFRAEEKVKLLDTQKEILERRVSDVEAKINARSAGADENVEKAQPKE